MRAFSGVLGIGRVAALAIGVAMLGSTAVPGDARAGSAADLLAKKTAILENLHRKASKALVTSAQDKVFGQYFGGDQSQKSRIEKLSLNVQHRFHVEEMCLIDPRGHEISRIVANKVAPDEDLSTEEATAPFFEPGFSQAHRHTHISPVYMSPDADKWVIAYVTPVVVQREKRAILHYEHTVEAYQRALNHKVDPAREFVLAVSPDGFVISDSRREIAIGKKGDSEAPADYFDKLPPAIASTVTLGGSGTGSVRLGDVQFDLAYRTIQDWTIVVGIRRH